LFFVGTLGISVAALGLIEGIAEATALISKVFSGVLSDWVGRRKGLAVLGYGLSAATKPLFALATGVGLVSTARFVDRIGKGVRDAPRDALLADVAPQAVRGAAYGLRQSLDTVGAFAGPLIATALMWAWGLDLRAIFWVAVVPGVLAVTLLALGVREPARPPGARAMSPIRREALKQLGAGYWRVVLIGVVFTLARFSEAFLVLRAQQAGLAAMWVPLVMVAMNLAYAATAYPAGRLSDRIGSRGLLAAGLAVLVVADVALAWGGAHLPWLLAGVALWGIHMGLTQGLLSAMVADHAPADLRGTAFGVFNLMSGGAMLLASALAGALWQTWGANVTFAAGGAFALSALIGLLARARRPQR
jgi:MFS family permease